MYIRRMLLIVALLLLAGFFIVTGIFDYKTPGIGIIPGNIPEPGHNLAWGMLLLVGAIVATAILAFFSRDKN